MCDIFSYSVLGLKRKICLFGIANRLTCFGATQKNFFGPFWNVFFLLLLAHLSRRLTGELIGYTWIRRPSVVVRPSTFSNIFSSETAWPKKSQILCGASLGRGNESLYKWSRSHDQDGRHAHIWQKSSPEPAGRFSRKLGM